MERWGSRQKAWYDYVERHNGYFQVREALRDLFRKTEQYKYLADRAYVSFGDVILGFHEYMTWRYGADSYVRATTDQTLFKIFLFKRIKLSDRSSWLIPFCWQLVPVSEEWVNTTSDTGASDTEPLEVVRDEHELLYNADYLESEP